MSLIALGANLPSRYGPPEATLRAAIAEVEARGIVVLAVSSIWLTAPVPISDQPWYRNAVIAVQTEMEAKALMGVLHEVERGFGRVRVPGERDAPRLLDLDLIAYNDEVFEEDGLVVPHPRMHLRAFVLRPLAEVAPRWRHPVLGLFVSELIETMPEGQDIEISQERAA